jgi:hypothetical protein
LAATTDPAAYGPVSWVATTATISPTLAEALGADGQDAKMQTAALDRTLRQGLANLGIPASAGASTIELMADSARRFSAMSSDAERSAMRQEARRQVEAVYGPDAAKEYTAVLQQWRSKSPKAVDALINSDYFSDPRVLGQLATRARLNAARKGLK